MSRQQKDLARKTPRCADLDYLAVVVRIHGNIPQKLPRSGIRPRARVDERIGSHEADTDADLGREAVNSGANVRSAGYDQ